MTIFYIIFTKIMLSSNNVNMLFYGILLLSLNETTSFIWLLLFVTSMVLFLYFSMLSYADTENKTSLDK